GWSGVVGPNGAGKTTLLKLATGLLKPNTGSITTRQNSVYCPQRTDDIPEKLNELISGDTKSAHIIKSRLGVCDDWDRRWATLSHGERKRAQIAVALWLRPDVLAIDEPTNHIDSQACEIIAQSLRSFKGVGLIVSHNRELLDLLCQQCFFIETPDIIARPGGITKGMETAKAEQQSLEKQRVQKKHAYKTLQKEAARRRELAIKSHKLRSKQGLARKDHDAREKKDRARVSGKDGVGGKLRRQLKGRLEQIRKNLENTTVKKQHTLGIWLPGSVSKRNFLLELPAGSLSLGGQKQLCYPELHISPGDRIAVTGPNGAGKSTLIRFIADCLNVSKEHITYVPQEIDLNQSQEILAQALTLPKDKLGHLMTIVSRLGSRPEKLLNSDVPSPGEIRKLLLAIGMTYTPHITIMDEPTNHMDLPSIECLEQALKNCPCSLLLVSHDRYFLSKLTNREWNITPDSNSLGRYVLSKL
ncbi:MAG: ABC-F family ATP-binding cassette domain-containing protein, partial [Sedimentisphaerales bacterium]|nr:ABC-F family ATP-binding cassette domain-containing protein [Sedimentisphaerales bacterium]